MPSPQPTLLLLLLFFSFVCSTPTKPLKLKSYEYLSATPPQQQWSNRCVISSTPLQNPHEQNEQWRYPSRARHRGSGPAMCGVIGILLADSDAQVSPELYDGLTILQHRGQDAAGIATSDGQKIRLKKDKGLVRVLLFV